MSDGARATIQGLTAESSPLTRHSVVTTADDAAAHRLASTLRVSPKVGIVWVCACYILLTYAGTQMLLGAKQMVHGAAREVRADVVSIRHVTAAAVQIALTSPSLTWSQIEVDDAPTGDDVVAPAAAAAAVADNGDDDDDDDTIDAALVAAAADVHALFAAVPDTKGKMANHMLVHMPLDTSAEQMQQLASTVFNIDPNIVLVRVHDSYIHVQLSKSVRCSTAVIALHRTCHGSVLIRAANGTRWNKIMRSGVVTWTHQITRKIVVQPAEQQEGYLSVVINGRSYQHGAGQVFESYLAA